MRKKTRRGLIAASIRALFNRTRHDDMVQLDGVERLRVASRRSAFAVSLDGEVVARRAAARLPDPQERAAGHRALGVREPAGLSRGSQRIDEDWGCSWRPSLDADCRTAIRARGMRVAGIAIILLSVGAALLPAGKSISSDMIGALLIAAGLIETVAGSLRREVAAVRHGGRRSHCARRAVVRHQSRNAFFPTRRAGHRLAAASAA